MDVAIQRPMTVAEFLAWEEGQELRYEFDGERAIAMHGGTLGHEIIGANVRSALFKRLHGTGYRAFGPTLKIEVVGHIRYPDAFVCPWPVDRNLTVAPNPVVIFEVISPGSSHTDRLTKLREYQATQSIQQYVILEQDSVAAMVFRRHAEFWDPRGLLRGDLLAIPAIGIELPLPDFYIDLDLPEPDDADDAPPKS